jgi:subtilisin family serine protease
MRFLAGVAAVLSMLAVPGAALGAGDPRRGEQWGLDMVESDAAHQVSAGAGAVVAVVDSGVDASHPDLAGRLLPGHDFVDDDAVPQDGNGHGTHVTGIIAADTGNGVGVASVAPGAKVLPVRVLDDGGAGDSADVAAGVDWAVAHGADVINLSLGEEVPLLGAGSEFAAALDRALDKGVVVVAASGNNGLPVCEQPQSAGRLLCVGAVDKRRQRSYFSSFGDGLNLVAPGGSGLPAAGEDVLSTWKGGGYETEAGTSQAAPFVSGVAALLASKGVGGQGAADLIVATASDAGPPGDDPQFGAGIVNARAALAHLPGRQGAGGGSRGAGGVAVAKVQRIRAVLKHGIKVRCRAAGTGRCRAAARRKSRRRLAYGSHRVQAGKAVTFHARVNRRGRRLLRRALRRHRAVTLNLRVTVPGLRAQVRRVRLRP